MIYMYNIYSKKIFIIASEDVIDCIMNCHLYILPKEGLQCIIS